MTRENRATASASAGKAEPNADWVEASKSPAAKAKGKKR